MGAKGSKPEKKPETDFPTNTLINTQDPRLFPQEVRMEFQNIFNPTTLNNQPFRTILLDESSKFIQWIRASKSYFEHGKRMKRLITPEQRKNIEDQVANLDPIGKLLLRNTLLRSFPLVEVEEEQSKLPFLYSLNSMCNSSDIDIQFLANLLDSLKEMVLAITKEGYIAGFSIIDERIHTQGTYGKKNYKEIKCLHRHVTCTGPRGIGLGKALVNFIHNLAEKRGYTCVTLEAAGSKGFHEKQKYKNMNANNTSESPLMIYTIQKGGKRKTRKHRK